MTILRDSMALVTAVIIMATAIINMRSAAKKAREQSTIAKADSTISETSSHQQSRARGVGWFVIFNMIVYLGMLLALVWMTIFPSPRPLTRQDVSFIAFVAVSCITAHHNCSSK